MLFLDMNKTINLSVSTDNIKIKPGSKVYFFHDLMVCTAIVESVLINWNEFDAFVSEIKLKDLPDGVDPLQPLIEVEHRIYASLDDLIKDIKKGNAVCD